MATNGPAGAGPGLTELEALHGHFEDCLMDVAEFEGMLAAPTGRLRSRR